MENLLHLNNSGTTESLYKNIDSNCKPDENLRIIRMIANDKIDDSSVTFCRVQKC